MCIHEGGLAFVKKNCEILWWNNFHFCHIVFIVHSWLGIEGFLSFVWCRCCGAESCFRRLYFPTLLLTITWSRERGLSHGDKGCMSSSDLALIYSGRWGRGVKDGKRKRGQEGGKKTRGRWRTENLILLPHWVRSLGCSFQPILVSHTFLLFLMQHYLHFT